MDGHVCNGPEEDGDVEEGGGGGGVGVGEE